MFNVKTFVFPAEIYLAELASQCTLVEINKSVATKSAAFY